jgi:hypothetical protein
MAVYSLASSSGGFAQTATAPNTKQEELLALRACAKAVAQGFRPVASTRELRFLGKVSDDNALCRGGVKAEMFRGTPWVDWTNYWGTGDMASLPTGFISAQPPTLRGVSGALLDLEFERVELIKFNLFDNSGTYKDYITGRANINGPALKTWPSMRLPSSDCGVVGVGGRNPGLQRRSRSRPQSHRHLQRRSKPAHGIGRNFLRTKCRV